VEGYVQLAPQFVPGLKDLEGFDRVWLIYWFDRASAATLSVVPYRDVVARGLFSTRAPARVNPIGLSNVKLIEIQGSVLRIGDVSPAATEGTSSTSITGYQEPTWWCGDRAPRCPLAGGLA
jgi:tRNA (Thr-GGU) A37 N-methylase